MRNEDFFEEKRAFCICRSRVFIVPFWYAIKIKKMKHIVTDIIVRKNSFIVQTTSTYSACMLYMKKKNI